MNRAISLPSKMNSGSFQRDDEDNYLIDSFQYTDGAEILFLLILRDQFSFLYRKGMHRQSLR
jgi:hypothetical protein